MKVTKELDDTLIKLMEVDKSLFHLCNNLIVKEEEYLNYLSIALEVEDKIINSIEITDENSEQLLRRYTYLITQKEWNRYETECIKGRFQNYLAYRLYNKPFPSVNWNKMEETSENIDIISNYAKLDCIYNLFFLLHKEIEKEKNPTIKRELAIPFYTLCFSHKPLEKSLKNPLTIPSLNGRKRCIDFGHEKQAVNTIYYNFSINTINNLIQNLFQYPDNLLKEDIRHVAAQKMELIKLKATLYLLKEEEIYDLYQQHYYAITNGNLHLQEFYKTTTSNILSTFENSYKEVKEYSKKKENKK